MEVIKVKPWGKGQGDYVLINAADFDASKHELYDEEKNHDEHQAKLPVKTRTRK